MDRSRNDSLLPYRDSLLRLECLRRRQRLQQKIGHCAHPPSFPIVLFLPPSFLSLVMMSSWLNFLYLHRVGLLHIKLVYFLPFIPLHTYLPQHPILPKLDLCLCRKTPPPIPRNVHSPPASQKVSTKVSASIPIKRTLSTTL